MAQREIGGLAGIFRVVGGGIFIFDEEDFFPHGEDVLPHEEDFLPHENDVLPHEEDFCPHEDDVLPHEEDFLPHGEDVLPHEEDFCPHEDDVLPHEEDFLPHENDVLPHEEDFFPHEDDVLPHEEDFLPHENDVLPHEEDFFPHEDDVLPREEDFFLREEDFFPHENALRPHERGTGARGHAYGRRGAGVICAVELRMAGGERQGGGGEVRVDISRLPLPGSDLVGRDEETTWLDACWSEGAHVATIVAPGGVGKSTLVWSWVQRMLVDGWRGAERVYAWSFYSQGANDQQVSADPFVHAALAWLGDADPSAGGPWEKVDRLVAALRARRTLLVLDGLEPLQWASGPEVEKLKDKPLSLLVWRLAEQNPGLCVITSRLPVRDVGDFAKEKSRPLVLGKLSDEAGEKLLRARGVVGEEGELRKTVREYRGHALALALLGSYLAEVGEGKVERRHEIGPLVEEERLGGHAKRVMAAYEKMFGGKSAEVGILRMLALFDRPATEGELKALRAEPVVVGLTEGVPAYAGREWNKAVEKLRRVGLVERAGREGDKRLDAHPLVREYFGERVRREQGEAWRQGNGRLYEYLKEVAKPLPETVVEMDPLYAAVVHGCRAGKSQEALDEVWCKRIERYSVDFNSKKLGAFGNGLAVLSAFFDPPWRSLAPGLTQRAQAFVMHCAGYTLRALGRPSDAEGLMRVALERLTSEKDWEIAASSAGNLSEILQTRGELDEALAQARKSVEFADWCGSAYRSHYRTTEAATLHAMGLREEAAEGFEAAAFIHMMEGEPEDLHLYSLGGFRYCDLLLDEGAYADVLKRAAETLEFATVHLALLDVALDHLSLGRAHILDAQRSTGGDLAQAASHLKDAVDGLRRAGTQDMLPLGLLARAALHTHTRAFDLARADLAEALSIATRCGFRLHECDAHLGWARLCIAQRDRATALDHLDTAGKIIAETEYHRRDAELTSLEAEAHALPLAPNPSPPPTIPAADQGPSPMPGTEPESSLPGPTSPTCSSTAPGDRRGTL